MNNRAYSSSKSCVTCNFWMGQRILAGGSLRNIVECVPNTKGDCVEGGLRKTFKMYNASCSKWQKWGAFRS